MDKNFGKYTILYRDSIIISNGFENLNDYKKHYITLFEIDDEAVSLHIDLNEEKISYYKGDFVPKGDMKNQQYKLAFKNKIKYFLNKKYYDSKEMHIYQGDFFIKYKNAPVKDSVKENVLLEIKKTFQDLSKDFYKLKSNMFKNTGKIK